MHNFTKNAKNMSNPYTKLVKVATLTLEYAAPHIMAVQSCDLFWEFTLSKVEFGFFCHYLYYLLDGQWFGLIILVFMDLIL